MIKIFYAVEIDSANLRPCNPTIRLRSFACFWHLCLLISQTDTHRKDSKQGYCCFCFASAGFEPNNHLAICMASCRQLYAMLSWSTVVLHM